MTAALTLWQPHASDVAEGRKRFETRSTRLLHSLLGERLLIHAGQTFDPGPQYRGHERAPESDDPLPTGVIVASCIVGRELPIGGPTSFSTGIVEGGPADFPGHDVFVLWPAMGSSEQRLVIDHAGGAVVDASEHLPFGDWTCGRWAYELTHVADTHARCPRCWGHPKSPSERVEGGSTSCAHCNRTRTFNFVRDPGEPCTCERALLERCETCRGAGVCDPIPARGMPGVWQWP